MGEEQKLQLEYPCLWQYRLIGGDEESLRAAICECLGGRGEVKRGQASSGGKYVSVQVELEVADEEERVAHFRRLAAHPQVKMVL